MKSALIRPPNLIVFGLSAAIVLSARALLTNRYNEERRTIEFRAYTNQMARIGRSWNALNYVASSNLASALIEQIEWKTLQLSDSQESQLRLRLFEVFSYLQAPSFEKFYKIKTEGMTWHLNRTKLLRILERHEGQNTVLPDGSPYHLIQSLWTAKYGAVSNDTAPRLTAICLDSVKIATSKINATDSIEEGPVSKPRTISHLSEDIGIDYDLASTVTENLEAGYCYLSFFAHSNASPYAGPVYLSFSWSCRDQKWALGRYISDVLLHADILF